jgi:hypothetical protein
MRGNVEIFDIEILRHFNPPPPKELLGQLDSLTFLSTSNLHGGYIHKMWAHDTTWT